MGDAVAPNWVLHRHNHLILLSVCPSSRPAKQQTLRVLSAIRSVGNRVVQRLAPAIHHHDLARAIKVDASTLRRSSSP